MRYDECWITVRERVGAAVRQLLVDAGLPNDIAERAARAGRLNRATLYCLLVASDRDIPSSIARIGGALELVHRASVIHDDIQDRDTVRRGSPTEVSLLGMAGALAVADLFVTVALRTLNALAPDALPRVLATMERMAIGQYYDIEGAPSGLLSDPFRIAELKTGSLLGLAFWMGGLHSERSTDDRESLSAIGTHIGTAFQLANDVNNVTWHEGRDKPVGSDIRNRRYSSVLIMLEARRAQTASDCDQASALAEVIRDVSQEIVQRLGLARACAASLAKPLPGLVHQVVFDPELTAGFVADQQTGSGSDEDLGTWIAR